MYTVYTVRPGDTLKLIADKTNTGVETLASLNGLNQNAILSPNMNIIVPSSNSNFMNYNVQKGDSIYSIARKYNIDPVTILKLNGLSQTDIIYPGDSILIPNENIIIYITKVGDTIKSVLNQMNTTIQNIMTNNEKIFLEEDQLIIAKK